MACGRGKREGKGFIRISRVREESRVKEERKEKQYGLVEGRGKMSQVRQGGDRSPVSLGR